MLRRQGVSQGQARAADLEEGDVCAEHARGAGCAAGRAARRQLHDLLGRRIARQQRLRTRAAQPRQAPAAPGMLASAGIRASHANATRLLGAAQSASTFLRAWPMQPRARPLPYQSNAPSAPSHQGRAAAPGPCPGQGRLGCKNMAPQSATRPRTHAGLYLILCTGSPSPVLFSARRRLPRMLMSMSGQGRASHCNTHRWLRHALRAASPRQSAKAVGRSTPRLCAAAAPTALAPWCTSPGTISPAPTAPDAAAPLADAGSVSGRGCNPIAAACPLAKWVTSARTDTGVDEGRHAGCAGGVAVKIAEYHHAFALIEAAACTQCSKQSMSARSCSIAVEPL